MFCEMCYEKNNIFLKNKNTETKTRIDRFCLSVY